MTIRYESLWNKADITPDFEERLKPPPAPPERREHGELTHWTNSGFGFITPLGAKKDRSTDIFIHRSCLRAAGINEPVRGMLLDYVVGLGDNGRERVVRVWPAAEIVR